MKEIQMYQCGYCTKKMAAKGSMARHELSCFQGPGSRSCHGCARFVWDEETALEDYARPKACSAGIPTIDGANYASRSWIHADVKARTKQDNCIKASSVKYQEQILARRNSYPVYEPDGMRLISNNLVQMPAGKRPYYDYGCRNYEETCAAEEAIEAGRLT